MSFFLKKEKKKREISSPSTAFTSVYSSGIIISEKSLSPKKCYTDLNKKYEAQGWDEAFMNTALSVFFLLVAS